MSEEKDTTVAAEETATEETTAPAAEETKTEDTNGVDESVEVPEQFKKLVEQVEAMSVLELHELVKVLEKRFGVSAAAVAVAGPAAGGDALQGRAWHRPGRRAGTADVEDQAAVEPPQSVRPGRTAGGCDVRRDG